MIEGDGKFLTDEQWIKLMFIIADDKPIHLVMPTEINASAVLYRDGIRYEIYPSGTFLATKAPMTEEENGTST
jgi:hypothetical protein